MRDGVHASIFLLPPSISLTSCPFSFTFKIIPLAKRHRSAAESETAPRS